VFEFDWLAENAIFVDAVPERPPEELRFECPLSTQSGRLKAIVSSLRRLEICWYLEARWPLLFEWYSLFVAKISL